MIPIVLAVLGPSAEARRPVDANQVESLRQRREGSLEVGGVAPDGPVGKLDGAEVRLLAGRRTDRPLVLLFGSFT